MKSILNIAVYVVLGPLTLVGGVVLLAIFAVRGGLRAIVNGIEPHPPRSAKGQIFIAEYSDR